MDYSTVCVKFVVPSVVFENWIFTSWIGDTQCFIVSWKSKVL